MAMPSVSDRPLRTRHADSIERLPGLRIATLLRSQSLRRALLLGVVLVSVAGCGASTSLSGQGRAAKQSIRIELDGGQPSASTGTLVDGPEAVRFTVGYGRNGIACAGSRFEEGWTPLGTFRVNAILSEDHFEMDPALVKESGKSEAYLRENLFRNMSSIDFKGDGETGEYGLGYISLSPVPATPQPFRFNTYDGTFRWYSFAIHGTNDPSRVGQSITGGCINVDRKAMTDLLKTVKLGDEVVISSESPCTP